jgi:hypothetical protein
MELTTRYSGETKDIEKIYVFLLYVNKTIKLHTMFTRAGLQNVLSKLNEDKDILSFIFDITESFRSYLIDINNVDVEDRFIKEIAKKISFKVSDDDLRSSLLPTEFNDNFVSSEDIELLIKANIWLLPVVLIRFTNFYSHPKNATSK